jgi:glycerol-3-phosphate dehydrogenase
MGGKWTTYRAMAEDAINAVQNHLGTLVTPSVTRNHPLSGVTWLRSLGPMRPRSSNSRTKTRNSQSRYSKTWRQSAPKSYTASGTKWP